MSGTKIDVNAARELESIQGILSVMEVTNKDLLKVDKSLLPELKSYLNSKSVLSPTVVATDPTSVRTVQEGLYTIQGWLDRAVAINMDTRRVLRVLGKVEILVKRELAKAGMISEKTSKPSADQMISLVVPELRIHQGNWTYVKKLCKDVQDHLSGAKSTVQMQIKLDENLNWAQRRGG